LLFGSDLTSNQLQNSCKELATKNLTTFAFECGATITTLIKINLQINLNPISRKAAVNAILAGGEILSGRTTWQFLRELLPKPINSALRSSLVGLMT
jgi:hypothetical protein